MGLGVSWRKVSLERCRRHSLAPLLILALPRHQNNNIGWPGQGCRMAGEEGRGTC